MRWNPPLLYLALAVFVASAAAILLWFETGSRLLAIGATAGNLVAAILFILSLWFPRRRVDWARIEAEQRLWESGPLGRSWLRIRRGLYHRWRL